MHDSLTGAEWLDRYGITFDWSATGYHVDSDGWEHHRYTLELTGPDAQVITFPWRQGLAVDDEPTADGTLWAVASDMRTGELDWPEFAGEFGYDELDAPLSAYRTWEACRDMVTRMQTFCEGAGVDMFGEFLAIEEAPNA